MLASIDGHKPIIELLIAHKADVNLRELKCVERRNLNSVDLSDNTLMWLLPTEWFCGSGGTPLCKWPPSIAGTLVSCA